MSKISDNSFIVIKPFMVTELNLSGNELLTFAVIFGFSQDGKSWFNGSAGYIAEWCNSTKQSIYKVLNKLVDKGLIEKRDYFENGVKYCLYRVSTKFSGVVNKVDRGVVNKVDRGTKQSLHNNIVNNIDIDNIDIYKENKKTKKEFIPPTIDEVRQYCKGKNYNIDAEQFVSYYESNNWKDKNNAPVKNWKLKLVVWSKNSNSSYSKKGSMINQLGTDEVTDEDLKNINF